MLVMLTDYLILSFCFWLALSLRINSIYIPDSNSALLLIILSPFIAIPILFSFGLYKSLIRYSNFLSVVSIAQAITIYTFLWFMIVIAAGIVDKPYDFLFINWICSVFFTGFTRYFARWIFQIRAIESSNVVIFGAGSAGIQLKFSLDVDHKFNVVGFIDSNKNLQGRFIDGKRVFSPSEMEDIIDKYSVKEIFIAIPSLSRPDRKKLLKSLDKHKLAIKILPKLTDLAEGKVSVSDLKRVEIKDLLDREIRKPDHTLLSKSILGKNVLVTGAGGSIGSELCRQILKQNPRKLVLFEINEYSLYRIERELSLTDSQVEIICILGNILHKDRFSNLLKSTEIQTVYHAAAYKHVPMVEKNIIPAVETNILGTYFCLMASIKQSVESFVYISTDKAVRPTNIMGSSKRFVELILQSISQSDTYAYNQMKVSMVRFGNVLGSSGSVVPLFSEQIRSGGPVTVTDPNIIRYFMTISEAAELVIQAGSMKSNGDIFILDMGSPMSILKLATDMIRLSGMTVKDKENPDGEIEIVFTGLRKGEKLFEELLVDDKSIATSHEKIFKAYELALEWEIISDELEQIKKGINDNNESLIRRVFDRTIDKSKVSDPKSNI